MKDPALHALSRTVSVKELAMTLNLTGERLRQLTHMGILKKEGRGQFHLARSLKSWFEYKEAEFKRQIALSVLRNRLIEARTREIELRFSEKCARLMPRSEAEQMLGEVCAIVKEELEDLPAHLAGDGYSIDEINRLKVIFSEGLVRIEQGRNRAVRRLRTGAPD